jgi:hypothetical protein
LHPVLPFASQIKWKRGISIHEVLPLMAIGKSKGYLRAFLDFFILFSGISTASNLARTQGRPLQTRGVFLFRAGNDR